MLRDSEESFSWSSLLRSFRIWNLWQARQLRNGPILAFEWGHSDWSELNRYGMDDIYDSFKITLQSYSLKFLHLRCGLHRLISRWAPLLTWIRWCLTYTPLHFHFRLRENLCWADAQKTFGWSAAAVLRYHPRLLRFHWRVHLGLGREYLIRRLSFGVDSLFQTFLNYQNAFQILLIFKLSIYKWVSHDY